MGRGMRNVGQAAAARGTTLAASQSRAGEDNRPLHTTGLGGRWGWGALLLALTVTRGHIFKHEGGERGTATLSPAPHPPHHPECRETICRPLTFRQVSQTIILHTVYNLLHRVRRVTVKSRFHKIGLLINLLYLFMKRRIRLISHLSASF